VVYVTELMGNETPAFLRLDMDKADFFDAESGEALR
jgi:hypothetical protein